MKNKIFYLIFFLLLNTNTFGELKFLDERGCDKVEQKKMVTAFEISNEKRFNLSNYIGWGENGTMFIPQADAKPTREWNYKNLTITIKDNFLIIDGYKKQTFKIKKPFDLSKNGTYRVMYENGVNVGKNKFDHYVYIQLDFDAQNIMIYHNPYNAKIFHFWKKYQYQEY